MAESFALLTGGSSGIGAATCQSLLDAGYQVISLARRAGQIKSPHLHEIQVDLTDIEATRSVSVEVARRFPVTTVMPGRSGSGPSSRLRMAICRL
jgi:NADP-dependent 3-hydroxy acid dehydrogenase YdfG